MTVRELLSHTAGFGDYPEKFDFRKDWTEDEELQLVESIPLAYPPGTKWKYSNLGYLTLGVLIHRVTGDREIYAAAEESPASRHADDAHHQRG